MSATNRGTKRVEKDFYPTPENAIIPLLENYKLPEGTILEPCAGNGNIIQALRKYGYKNKVIANEIREEENKNLVVSGADEILHEDFLLSGKKQGVSTLITNPPFSLAQEFLEHAFSIYPRSNTIMLLSLSFLESKKRYYFWQKHPVNKLFVLNRRPSFTGKGTDAQAYAWFVWDGSETQEIRIV